MSERTKDVVLLLLVVTSLVLTSRLLFGQPTLEAAKPPAYEHLAFGDLRPLGEQVLPELRVRLEENSWRLLNPWQNEFPETWDMLLNLMLTADSVETIPALPAQPQGLMLVASFPAAVPLAAFGAERLEGVEADRLVWYAVEPEHIWLREPTGSWLKARVRSQPELADELAQKMAGLPRYVSLQEQKPVLPVSGEFLLPLEAPQMAPRLVTRESLALEKLVRSIFVDTALVRLIEEREGAFIYTDGQKGLRVFAHGEVELTSPHSEPGSRPMSTLSALRRTAQFLQLLGGWPATLYLASLHREGSPAYQRRQWDSYTVTFTAAQHGYRLLGPHPPVKLHFADRGVIYFTRLLRTLGEETKYPRPLIDPLEALEAARRLWTEGAEKPEVEALFAAYYLRDPAALSLPASPVWALRFIDGRTAVIDGFSGAFRAWLE